MKTRMVIVFALCLFAVTSVAQKKSKKFNKVMVDPKLKREILIGKCTREGLQWGEFDSTAREEFKYYQPDATIMEQLKAPLKKVKITIVLASWCGDSKEQVPRFFKILDQAGYKQKVTLICVDRNFQGGEVKTDGLFIKKVPTFIFYRGGMEVGRIIETPTETLEQDLLKLIHEHK
ncbi:MAG: thioredoxin family protein [Bacteroidetes bacterium]|nr:thioredoxin family protein [Bacteroidota bacterium]